MSKVSTILPCHDVGSDFERKGDGSLSRSAVERSPRSPWSRSSAYPRRHGAPSRDCPCSAAVRRRTGRRAGTTRTCPRTERPQARRRAVRRHSARYLILRQITAGMERPPRRASPPAPWVGYPRVPVTSLKKRARRRRSAHCVQWQATARASRRRNF